MSDVVQIQRLRGDEADKQASTRVPAEGQLAVVLDEQYAVLGDGSTQLQNLRPMEDRRIDTVDNAGSPLTITNVSPSVIAADTTAGPCEINLPALSENQGRRLYVINVEALNPITINADSGDVIGSAGDASITVDQSTTTTILIAHATYWEQVATGGGSGTGTAVAVGTIFPFAASDPPVGAVECDGAAVSRSVYAELFDVIGTTWGAGDGSTTFNLPDLRGAFVRGTGSHGTETMADGNPFAGPAVGAFEDDQMEDHRHLMGFSNNTPATDQSGSQVFAAQQDLFRTTSPDLDGRFNMLSQPSKVLGTGHTPRAGDETRPFAAGVKYCIQASRVGAVGTPITSLRYDTGWIANSDWTNAEFTINHNLGDVLPGLIVKVFFSSDGTDVNAQEVKSATLELSSSPAATIRAGVFILSVDDNSVKLQTGAEGVYVVGASGSFTLLDTEAWYYRVLVYKPEVFTRSEVGSVRNLSADYTISGRQDARIFNVTTGATDITVTLPAGADMVPGDDFEIHKVDSGTGKVIVARAGSDTIDGVTSIDINSQYHFAKLRWLGDRWAILDRSASRLDAQLSQTDGDTDRLMKVGGFGIGDFSPIESTDADNLTTPGLWTIATSAANNPTGGSNSCVVIVQGYQANRLTQIAMAVGTVGLYMRYYTGSWSAWTQIATV